MFEQLFHSWAYIQGIPHPITEIFIPTFIAAYSWKQRIEINLIVFQQIKG